jgi:hypothetical protein
VVVLGLGLKDSADDLWPSDLKLTGPSDMPLVRFSGYEGGLVPDIVGVC